MTPFARYPLPERHMAEETSTQVQVQRVLGWFTLCLHLALGRRSEPLNCPCSSI